MGHRFLELVGSCEHSNEPLGSIKGRKLLLWVTISSMDFIDLLVGLVWPL